MKRFRKRTLLTIGVLAVLILYPATQMLRLCNAAEGLRGALQGVKEFSLSDSSTVRNTLNSVSETLSVVEEVTHDPVLSALGFVPVISSDWEALKATSTSLARLASAANTAYSASLNLDARGSGFGVNPAMLKPFAKSVRALQHRALEASSALNNVNTKSLHFGLGSIYSKATAQVFTLKSGLKQVDPLVQVSAVMLSDSAVHRWFVASQNLAETRGTGGLIGSYLVLETKNGKVKIVESGSDKDLALRYPIPRSAQPQGFISDWGIERGLWIDMNASADVPTSSNVILKAWNAKRNEPLAGVLFIGQGTMAHLLALVGPVEVDGRILDYRNAGAYLARDVYSDYPDYRDKDQFVQKFSNGLKAQIESGETNIPALWDSAVTTKSGDFPIVWAANKAKERFISTLGIGGSIKTGYGHESRLGINNAGGNKLDAYLRISRTLEVGGCAFQTSNGLAAVSATATVTLTNGAPADPLPVYVWPPMPTNGKVHNKENSMHQLVTIYAPVGSDDQSFSIDGKEAYAQFGLERNRPKYSVRVALAPGASRTIKFTWIEPLLDDFGKRLKPVFRLVASPSFASQKVLLRITDSCVFGRK